MANVRLKAPNLSSEIRKLVQSSELDFEIILSGIEKIVAKNPCSSEAWLLKAQMHLALSQFAKAKSAIANLVRLETESLTAPFELADIFVSQNQPAKAAKILKEGIGSLLDHLKYQLINQLSEDIRTSKKFERALMNYAHSKWGYGKATKATSQTLEKLLVQSCKSRVRSEPKNSAFRKAAKTKS